MFNGDAGLNPGAALLARLYDDRRDSQTGHRCVPHWKMCRTWWRIRPELGHDSAARGDLHLKVAVGCWVRIADSSAYDSHGPTVGLNRGPVSYTHLTLPTK